MTEKRSQVLSQHTELDFHADRLQLLTQAPRDSLAPGRCRQILEREVRSLIERLTSHFHYEEHQGYMSGIVKDAPAFAEAVESLRQEHGALRIRMNQLRDLSFDDGRLEEFQSSILDFLTQLRQHEEAENELLGRFISH